MQEKKHNLELDVQYPDTRLEADLTPELVERWVRGALLGPAELAIRFVDAEEGQTLNREYRGKDYATNVLTFAYNEGAEIADDEPTQADIVLCTDVLQREADEQKKTVEEHAAHLVVHGVLHAQGFDHETDEEAEEMEQLERDIMEALGYPDPYAENE
ncbi:rRNA maturation RNase YbeY [Telluria mixta]|jgi:probable rRNA maturation factor|uniref:Endoribonuclease YbeY n=2 Tax=Telluria group TaxID=2895353 RepID=A0ABT2BZK9_9BURK|nr:MULTISPECIES: rRNA maturation RNase YbeY [Telluria group]KGF80583.1 rRNA maturation factor [Massilia sp. JS1662]MCS0630583.1 rRNA maturation RNase YbeY [Telluria mixta]WEM98591.1 rRNA maturation RNase YbeY [Telluria mixta]